MNDKVKIAIVVVCLAVAGVVVLLQLGVFDSGPQGAENTADANATGSFDDLTPEEGEDATLTRDSFR